MTRWRQGESVPHHVYRQVGDEPDTRPWPDGDLPVATFMHPQDAELCVQAVEAQRARLAAHSSIGLARSATELTATCKCGTSEVFPIGGDADARTWWERHGRAAGHALDYRAGFDDGVRYARDRDATSAPWPPPVGPAERELANFYVGLYEALDTDGSGIVTLRDALAAIRTALGHVDRPGDDPAALLRLAASGRREYAESGGPNIELLLHEALAYEQAARIVEGDLWSLQGALPSWRWMQIPASFTERGLYAEERPTTPAPTTASCESRDERVDRLTEAVQNVCDVAAIEVEVHELDPGPNGWQRNGQTSPLRRLVRALDGDGLLAQPTDHTGRRQS